MHLYTPPAPYFAGDPMPFFHAGTLHLFYLLDEAHHQGLGGLGGHQWAHATTTDLRVWTHHPLALPITLPDEGSICTGSVFWHAGTYYAFYAQRRRDWTQHLCLATSQDGLVFEKHPANPLLSPPPGYGRFDFRDPCVFEQSGRFHMLLSARLDPYPLAGGGGCLLRLVSDDLRRWQVVGPEIIPGGAETRSDVPECSDLFHWNGWTYLIFSLGLRTIYRMAHGDSGTWQRPPVELLDAPLTHVIKTAPIWDNRRIAVGFLGTRAGQRDSGAVQWAGSLVLRELIQHADGTLSTRFVPELDPAPGAPITLTPLALSGKMDFSGEAWTVNADPPIETMGVAALSGLPADYRLTGRLSAPEPTVRCGFGLRGSGDFEQFIDLAFTPSARQVSLGDQAITGFEGLRAPLDVDIRCQGDAIEVCVAGCRCLINRLPELRGNSLFFYAEGGPGVCQELRITPIIGG